MRHLTTTEVPFVGAVFHKAAKQAAQATRGIPCRPLLRRRPLPPPPLPEEHALLPKIDIERRRCHRHHLTAGLQDAVNLVDHRLRLIDGFQEPRHAGHIDAGRFQRQIGGRRVDKPAAQAAQLEVTPHQSQLRARRTADHNRRTVARVLQPIGAQPVT